MRKHINQVISHPLFSGSAILIIGSNAVSFLNYLYHLMMGRMLGPANYGELAAIISLIGLLGVIPGSLNLVVTRYISIAKNEREISALVAWLKSKIFLISLTFFLIIFSVSNLISSFLKVSNSLFLILVAISFLFSVQSLLNRAVLQGLLKFKEMIVSILAENGVKLLFGLILVSFGLQVGGALAGFVLSVVLGWFITNNYLKSYSLNKTSTEVDLRQMLLFSFPVLIQSISVTSLYSTDLILVKHFFSSHDAGIYAALSTLGKIIFFGTGPIGTVMFPLVSQRSSRGQAHKSIFIYSFLATTLLAIAILLFYWLFPQNAISILYGSAYIEASNLLVWFGIFITLFTLSSLLVNYSLSLGKTFVVVFPSVAAIMQIIFILFFHQTLFMVVLVSVIILTLLLASLLIYSIYAK